MVEQRTENPCVPGSIPGGTTFKGKAKVFPFLLLVMKYFVYIIYSDRINDFYIGQSVDVQERVKQHNSGFYHGASTKKADDWDLFWSLECESKKQAILIESHIKRMRNRNYYTNLKNYPEISKKLLQRYNDVPGSPR